MILTYPGAVFHIKKCWISKKHVLKEIPIRQAAQRFISHQYKNAGGSGGNSHVPPGDKDEMRILIDGAGVILAFYGKMC